MTRLLTIFCGLGFYLSAGATPSATANSAYIHDVEGLLNSVESKDSSRPQLTLKLADGLFNEALNLSGQPALGAADKRKMNADRRRAIQLYQDSLTGLRGMFASPSGAARGKIQFQLARLYADLEDSAQAEKIWQELANQDSMPEIQRESSLRLAEVLENRGSPADLKRAEGYYKKALALCSTQDVCSYSHYRLAWVYHRQERLTEAIAEMNQALWDGKGQVREESLRDLVAFLGGSSDDGKDSLSQMEKLSAKLKRPQLIGELADAYFARGNRKAGVHILDAVNRKNPTLKSYVRLMEEDYGFRDWTKFDTELDGAMELHAKGAVTGADAETEKVLRRLTVQLDGERASQPKSAEAFKKTVMLYLALYPARAERNQMIDGWIAAETENSAKLSQLQIWIGEEHQAQRVTEELRLRKIRASIAQKTKDFPVVIEEMTALAQLTKSPAEKREMTYQVAFAQYESKSYDAALASFLTLATLPSTGAPDKWAIQSEHLALDILARKKDYASVQTQARLWTADPRFAGWVLTAKEHKDELSDIQKVETSARFEWATQQGAQPEALKIFATDCLAGVYVPQSCANAQVLSVKLGDQKTLLLILQKLGKKDELAAELEASAEFSQAAALLDKKLKEKGASTRDYLKVALLFELGSSQVNRDRILHEMITHLATQKTLGDDEDLIFQTLKDADLLQASALKLPWKKETREFLTDDFVAKGKGTAEMQAQLLKTCHDTGPGWRKVTLSELARMDEKQNHIHFAGKNSKRAFEQRVQALKALGERGNCYLQSTTAEQRARIGTLLARSEVSFAEEIKASPIPAGVDEEGRASLQKALVEMAQPFLDKGLEFSKLAEEQLAKIENADTRVALEQELKGNSPTAGEVTREPAKKSVASAPHEALHASEPQSAEVLKLATQELHRNPNQRDSLVQLKSYYESKGNARLASYFQGRLLQLGDKSSDKTTEGTKQ